MAVGRQLFQIFRLNLVSHEMPVLGIQSRPLIGRIASAGDFVPQLRCGLALPLQQDGENQDQPGEKKKKFGA